MSARPNGFFSDLARLPRTWLHRLVWNYAVRPLEESDLRKRFGEEFQQYRETVLCWIPHVSKTHFPQRR